MENKLTKALIIPYFGRFPELFKLWLKSVSYNKTFTFFIFTDDKTEFEYPNNVKLYSISFKEMVNKIKEKIDLNIDISPYKLCDLRPAYGDIFYDYIMDYDYWGYCDIDLIFGNLEKFYCDELLVKYDKISDAGHFTLYKNICPLRFAYKNLTSKDCYIFKNVIKENRNFAFDEWGNNKGINRILINNGFKVYYHPILFSDICIDKYGLIPTRTKYGPKEDIMKEKQKHNICYSFLEGNLLQHYLDQNNSVCTHEESYVHMQKRPMIINTSICEKFLIVPPNRIIKYEDISFNFLKKIKEKRIYFHYLKIRFNNLIRKIKNV